ncbi:BQ2448_4113 [Microbotryum intermedium]|uniref:mannan endo-1,4-beta-mannosidase n=1 Tax=Microbotryum intermedium TaxID=269621 RepID=A0A238FNC2_9BASI|nr:BQ2448_4113 [Microbotryum intermedium]
MRYSILQKLWLGLSLICQIASAREAHDNGDRTRPRRFRGLGYTNRLAKRSDDLLSRRVRLLTSSAQSQMPKMVGIGKRSRQVAVGGVGTGGQTGSAACDTCTDPSPTPSDEPIVIRGRGTLPQSSSYLTLNEDRTGLLLDNKPFRPVGTNIYWLCNDENIAGRPEGYPSDKARVREALAAAVAMGANTVRIGSCGTSLGFHEAIQPDLHNYAGEDGMDIHDYAIWAAGQYGLKVILTLTDNYDYYHGGKYTILRWLGVTPDNAGAMFFTDERAIQVYLRYIKWVLGRVNRYNNFTYGTDPTISIVETGNELGAYMGKEGYPPSDWTDRVAQRIKQLAPQALVMDGTDGFYNVIFAAANAVAPGLLSPHIDIVTDHPYPRDIHLFRTQAQLAKRAKKVFLLGEMNWLPDGATNANLLHYLQVLDRHPKVGVLIWSLFTHDAQCSQYVLHNDSYSVYYPDGPNTPEEKQNILWLVQWFYRVTGRQVPTVLPVQTCPQEVF